MTIPALDELVRYDGRHVVVTGCASGIGAQVARQLGQLGARVTGLDLHEPGDKDSAAAEFVPLDLADPDSVAASTTSTPSDRPLMMRLR